MASESSKQAASKLLVWDFDWSMINDNCDVWVLTHLDSLRQKAETAGTSAPDSASSASQAEPQASYAKAPNSHTEHITTLKLADIQRNWMHAARKGGAAVSTRTGAAAPTTWTDGMHGLFQEAALRGHTMQEIQQAMAEIPVFDGVVECIRSLHASDMRQIVLSDANTHLIATWLQAVGIQDCFTHVISNHGTALPLEASTPEHHALHVEPLQPKAVPHGCANPCPPNLCKGGTLLAFFTAEYGPDSARWPRTAYVGDGRGDLCALLQLPEGCAAMVRGGYPLDKHTEKLLSSCADADAESATTVKVPGAPWRRAGGGGADDAATPTMVEVEVRTGGLRADRLLWEDGEQLVQHLRGFAVA